MPRNFNRLVLLLGAALLAGVPALHAQQTGAPVRGDVDGDGRVTAADARIVSDYLVGKPVPPGANVRERGDVNGDGRVTAVDAAIIARAAAGRDVSRFPVGKPAPDAGLAMVECAANVRARSLSCGEPGGLGDARGYVIVGGQNINVKLASSNLVINPADSTFTFDVTVQNLLKQSMGVDSATGAVNANGVRVFFFSGPTETEAAPAAPPGSGHLVHVANADGEELLLGSGPAQKYFQYKNLDLGADSILTPQDTSEVRTWTLKYDPGVNKFSFILYLAAEVQFPQGWIDVYPQPDLPYHDPSPTFIPTKTLHVGETVQLVDSVRNRFAKAVSPQPTVQWDSTSHGKAGVSATGLVTAHAVGTDTIIATHGNRSGRIEIVVIPGAPANMVKQAGDAQTDTAGQTLPVNPAVKITDGNGDPVPGVPVTFTPVAGSGSVTGGSTTTNALGIATVGSWTLGTAAGLDSLTASSPGLTNVTFTATAIAGAAANMVKTAGDGQTAAAGTAVATPPAVTITDTHGNPVSGVSVTFTPVAGSGSVTGGTTTTNASGVATVGSWTVGTAAGLDSLTASSSGLTDVTFTATVVAGPPANMVKSAGDGQSATVGTAVAVAPAVTITDSHGNPVSGAAVTFTPVAGNGSVTGGSTTTNASGVATVGSWTLGTVAKLDSLTASSPGVTSVTFTATATPGAPANIAKNAGDGQSAVVNTNVATAPQVKITDTYGNPVPGISVTFAPASGGGSVTGGSPTTDAAGLATVGSWKLGTTVGNNTLTATAGALNTTFSATATPDVPANIAKTTTDPQNGTVGVAVGTPPAVHVTDQFGNATPGYTVNFTIAGGGGSRTGFAPVTDASGNAVVGSWTPGSTAPGPNQLTATVSGGSNPSTTFTVYVPPVVQTDSSQAMGNTTLSNTVAPNLLSNDTGLNGEAIAFQSPTVVGANSTIRGGTLTLAANGSFTYLPPAGVTGRDSMLYKVGDSHASATAYIKFRFVGKVWYVDGSGPNGDGRDTSPFNSIANAEVSAGVNDSILVRTSTVAGGTLKNGQIVRGQGQNAAFTTTLNGQSVTLLASGGTPPNVGALTLGSGNSLRGVRIFNAAGGGLTGASIGTLSVGEISIGVTGGPALDLTGSPSGTITGNGGTGAAVFDSVRSTNSTTTGIALTNVAGTLTINGGTASNITGPTGTAFSISGSNPTVTFPGTISKTNASGTGILLSGMTGGSVSFTGPSVVLSTGSSPGINMSGSSATVSFVDSVKVTTTSGTGINATGGGTLTLTGSNNTVNSTGGGTAVNVSSTTLGGMTFKRVDATGSGTNGIVLSSTGAGAFTVTGDGPSDPNNTTRGRTTAKSGGGTITLGSGGSISGRSGDGISLNSTGAVTLRNLVITGSASSGDGIDATSVSGLTIDNTRITGHTNNSALFSTSVSAPVILHSEMLDNAFGASAPGADIHNVRLISNTGTGSVQSSVIANTSAGAERQLQIYSTTGTLNITVSNTRISGSTVGDGASVYAYGSSNITASFQSDSIHNNSAFGIDAGTETTQSSSLNITVNNTKFLNNFVGVTVAHGSSGTNTFNITNNNFQNQGSVSININRLAAVSFTSFGLFSGTVSGNTIGTAGVANSGSPLGSNTIDVKTNGNGGTIQVAVVNNTIREIGNDGIRVIGRDATTGHTLHARIENNNIANFNAAALSGIRGELGAASGDKLTMCLDIKNNTVSGAPQNGIRVRSVAGGSPPPVITLTMPSYDGTGATYLANRNPSGGTTSFANGNAGSTTTAGNCTTP